MLATRTSLAPFLGVALAVWCMGLRAQPLDPLSFPSLGTLSLASGGFTIDTDALTIVANAAPGTPLFTGVLDDQRGLADSFGAGGDVTTVGPLGIPHVAVFTFDGITLQTSANITVTGHRALALLSRGDALINTTIDVSGGGDFFGEETTGRPGGPGGFAGGTGDEDGFGPGGGGGAAVSGTFADVIGGGGGFGGAGGPGVPNSPPGGPAHGDLTGVLQGGSGGGGADDDQVPFLGSGGGGGGALEIGAAGFLEVGAAASLLANGGFGQFESFLGTQWGGGGSGGGVRLHGHELLLNGLIRARGGTGFQSSDGGPGGGGRVLLVGSPAVFLIGSTPQVSDFTTGIDVASVHPLLALTMSGVIGHIPLVTVVPGSQSFELGTVLSLQSATNAQPGVELIPNDLSVFGEVTVPAGGATNTHAIELQIAAARITGADPLTNQGLISGTGQIQVELINDPGGQINATNDTLTFTQAVTNNAGGQINAINGTLNFDAGLTNAGDLNLINTTVNGPVGSSSSIAIAGSNAFVGDVSGPGHFTGSGAATFAGSYSPGNSPAIVEFGGDVTFAATNTLIIELGGTALGEFDRLEVEGVATVGGTLQVDLIDLGGGNFAPQFGDQFAFLTAAGGTTGTFDDFDLPELAAGLEWKLNSTGATLSLAVALAGDFNGDGFVDAADYVVWRKTDGSPAAYNEWRAHFGQTSSGSATSSASLHVPEPASFLLFTMACIGALGAIRSVRSV